MYNINNNMKKIFFSPEFHDFEFDSVIRTLAKVWVRSSLWDQIRLIDLLPLYTNTKDDGDVRALYPNTKHIINGCFFPGVNKYKLRLVISFYFIIKINENENKVVFMNYKISEHKLYFTDITNNLGKDFIKFGLKNLIKNQVAIDRKPTLIRYGFYYRFSLGGKRKQNLHA